MSPLHGNGGSIVVLNFRGRRPRFWLIVGREGSGGGPLTVDPGGAGEALAVFGFEETARVHLLLADPNGRWRVTETRPEGLTSPLVAGDCRGAERAVADPVGRAGGREANRSPGPMSRRRFLGGFLGRLFASGPEAAVLRTTCDG